jgi:AcrR family transcriptional regulator
MGKPKGANTETYARTHAALLDAGRQLFPVRGFDAVSTNEICELAGTSHGSLFSHFKSKRDLFILIHNEWQDRLIDRIAAASAEARDPWTRFHRIWRTYLEATESAEMRQVLLIDGPSVIGLQELRRRDRETAFAFLREELEGLVAHGLIRPMDPRALTILIFGALDQAAFEIADFPQDRVLRRRLMSTTERLMESLRPATR